jgi:Adenylate and Guanylate cyclase catalytic domain
MFVQAAEQTYRLAAVSGRRPLYAAATHAADNKYAHDLRQGLVWPRPPVSWDLWHTTSCAVMAAFSRPDNAVRAALAIQDDIASFNSAHAGSMNMTPIVLKLGVHAGSCIAVITGDALDYFGASVNIAARLEHHCRGGEVIVSEAVAKDAETGAALADRTLLEETAMLRGVSSPVRFVRIQGLRSARLPVDWKCRALRMGSGQS